MISVEEFTEEDTKYEELIIQYYEHKLIDSMDLESYYDSKKFRKTEKQIELQYVTFILVLQAKVTQILFHLQLFVRLIQLQITW